MKKNIEITVEQARELLKAPDTPESLVEVIKSNFTLTELSGIPVSYEDLETAVGKAKTEMFKKLLFVAYKLNTCDDIESGTPYTISRGKETKNVAITPATDDFRYNKKSVTFKSLRAAVLAYEGNNKLFNAYWDLCVKTPVKENVGESKEIHGSIGASRVIMNCSRITLSEVKENTPEPNGLGTQICPETNFRVEEFLCCESNLKGKMLACSTCKLSFKK